MNTTGWLLARSANLIPMAAQGSNSWSPPTQAQNAQHLARDPDLLEVCFVFVILAFELGCLLYERLSLAPHLRKLPPANWYRGS